MFYHITRPEKTAYFRMTCHSTCQSSGKTWIFPDDESVLLLIMEKAKLPASVAGLSFCQACKLMDNNNLHSRIDGMLSAGRDFYLI